MNIGHDYDYAGARETLKKLMLLCDGCRRTGRPDMDDTIVDCAAQEKVYSALLAAYQHLAR